LRKPFRIDQSLSVVMVVRWILRMRRRGIWRWGRVVNFNLNLKNNFKFPF